MVAGLPRRDGHTLYVQLWNEPNLNLEWGGAANPTEYGQFLAQAAGAIRSATGGDPRLAILNAPLAPGGDIAPESFMLGMFANVPDSRWAFDLWAAHSYPGNYPPELNIHHGQAVRSDVTIDSYVPQVEILAANGRTAVPVFLSETGYLLGQQYDRRYPPVSESNRADYMSRAFGYYWRAWPELIGVAPYQLSDPGGDWSGWNWVEADGSRHAQYGSIQALDKSYPYAASQLTLTFQARAASTAGTYASNIEVSADNFGVSPQYGGAPVVVIPPTPTVTSTPTPSGHRGEHRDRYPYTDADAHPDRDRYQRKSVTHIYGDRGTPSTTATPSDTPDTTATPTRGRPLSLRRQHPARPRTQPQPGQPPRQQPLRSPQPPHTQQPQRARTPTRTLTPTPTPTATPVAIPISTVWVGQEPHGLAMDSERGRVYAALHRVPAVSVINGSTGARVRNISLGSASGANGVVYDPASDRIFVANKFTANVSRANAADGANLIEFPAGWQPNGVAVDPNTGITYVANFGSNTIWMLDGDTGALLREAPGGGEPSFIALDLRRGRFYVTNHLGATIGVYDLGSGTLLKTLPTGGGPYGIALDPAAGRLYTADRDGRSVTIADVDSDSIIKHMPLNCVPYQVAVNPASGHLFVVCADDRQMHIYDLDSTRWLAWVPVGRGAQEGIAVDTATGRVYVSNGGDDTVSIIQDSGPVNPPTPVPTRMPTATATPTVTPTQTLLPTPTATPTATATPTPWLPGEPDAYEPDDTPFQAGTLVIDAQPAERTFHRAGDIDWASFTAENPGQYLFRAVSTESIPRPWRCMRPTAQRSWPRSSRPPEARRRTWPGRPQRRASITYACASRTTWAASARPTC